MYPHHGLQVNLRVPVGVEEDDNVGGHEVDTEPAGTCTQHEDKLVAARSVVLVNLCL